MHDKTIIDMLGNWQIGLRILHRGHFECAKIYARRNLWFGVPTIIFSSAIGTTVIGSLEHSDDSYIRLLVGFMGIAAAVLASLQTFLNFSGRAEQHKAAAVKYGTLRREIEECLVSCSPDCPCPSDFCTNIRKRWDSVDMQSPTIPEKIFSKTEKTIKGLKG